VGSQSHEAFIYNVAMGRLDMYTFDIWNLNQCQCAYPQKGLDMCADGELAQLVQCCGSASPVHLAVCDEVTYPPPLQCTRSVVVVAVTVVVLVCVDEWAP
jgi:hypothetical protein